MRPHERDRAVRGQVARPPRRAWPTPGRGRCRRRPRARCGPADAVPDGLDGLGERAVEDDGDGVGVVPEVRQLVVGVPVVGVDRHQPGLPGGRAGLHVLRAVVDVEGDLVLVLGAGRRAGPGRRRRSAGRTPPTCTAGRRGPGPALGELVGVRFPDVGEVPTTRRAENPLRCDAQCRRRQKGPPVVGRARFRSGSGRDDRRRRRCRDPAAPVDRVDLVAVGTRRHAGVGEGERAGGHEPLVHPVTDHVVAGDADPAGVRQVRRGGPRDGHRRTRPGRR